MGRRSARVDPSAQHSVNRLSLSLSLSLETHKPGLTSDYPPAAAAADDRRGGPRVSFLPGLPSFFNGDMNDAVSRRLYLQVTFTTFYFGCVRGRESARARACM